MVDAVRQMLKEIQSTGKDGEIEYPELLETLTRLLPDPGATEIEIAPASSENIVVSPPVSRLGHPQEGIPRSRRRRPGALTFELDEAVETIHTLVSMIFGSTPTLP
jgi:hypothetical protein